MYVEIKSDEMRFGAIDQNDNVSELDVYQKTTYLCLE